jgi:hypothetical protein
LIDEYRDLWGEDHGYQSPNSDQKDIVDDKMDNVEKVDEDTEYKDNMEKDDVDEDEDVEVKVDEDMSFFPEVTIKVMMMQSVITRTILMVWVKT